MAKELDLFVLLLDSTKPLTNSEIMIELQKSKKTTDNKKKIKPDSLMQKIRRQEIQLQKVIEEYDFLDERFVFLKDIRKVGGKEQLTYKINYRGDIESDLNGNLFNISPENLPNQKEILVLTKLLVANRALNNTETVDLSNHLLNLLANRAKKNVKNTVLEAKLKKSFISEKDGRIDFIWELENNISNYTEIEFDYINKEFNNDPIITREKIMPVHLLFNNYYFFLRGFNLDKEEYKTYRIDWIKDKKVSELGKNTKLYRSIMEDHEQINQKNILAYEGEQKTITFEYHGYINYVLDKFPSAIVLHKDLKKDNEFDFPVSEIQISVNYSDGVKMWLLSEAPILKIIGPESVKNDMKNLLKKSLNLYDEDKDLH
ncbi:helix-turn-helix transcriptional regulator [Companilactobacillus bobalius]|uniref:WYL domain-containing protein n=2 Tax=Companilactobacillus bobalius TaxID=2801451 RepID=A0A202FG88_9LACO|nr:WYL domain-containing protein [Companilactobacillus bobalius]KAE9560145.1 hypothetical protein ATN92_07925 [Companilactobacillus bobalius]KRK82824.1 hypothetical protein FC78_GL001627 [Companilactobacillus bobalius DSM 19674]OVE99496.1 hypothetical protein LKACC16343_00609 [Companilactobacillus bobalius]GEO57477.1 WYL domain-containing protein [Companilactobacillus paralimentarius]